MKKSKLFIAAAFALAIGSAFTTKSSNRLLAADLYEQVSGCPADCSSTGSVTCSIPTSTSLFKKDANGHCNVSYTGARFQP